MQVIINIGSPNKESLIENLEIVKSILEDYKNNKHIEGSYISSSHSHITGGFNLTIKD